ncbi:MAG: OmpA family protein [Planctomycetes bacterium]|nr:OmpA family protein [Planctomycetota bacterium]MBZ0150144.1 OmpA family protein [Planctomycetota bacterium]MCC7397810.1 OmpA family protein [Planctomycetota bacterium]
MMFRKTILFLSLLVSALGTSCTSRYQDMLKQRDERIVELSGTVAQLRGENEELQQRLSARPAATEASAPRTEPSLLNELQNDIGAGASVSIRRGNISIGVEDSVTFDSGSTALKDTSHRVLKNVASVLKGKFSGHRFYVSGHTDTDPITKTKDKYSSNRDLSAKRADAVASYLIAQGVPEKSIVIVGYGQFDPIDQKTKARNRRVEIAVGEKF